MARNRHAAGNLPNKGHRLLYGVEAALAADEILRENDIRVLSVAEAYSDWRKAIRKNKVLKHRWRLIAGRPNSILRWGTVGNAILVDRDAKVIKKATCRVDYPGNRPLSIPVATLRLDGLVFTEAAAHLPIESSISSANYAKQLFAIRDFVVDQARDHGADYAVISMDSNRPRDRVQELLGRQWTCYALDGVMQVWVRDMGADVKKGKSGVVIRGYDERLSDHAGLPWADVVLRELDYQDRFEKVSD